MDLSQFEEKIFSQNGEDGITMKLIDLIYKDDPSSKFYVEFGVENGYECNTRILREKYRWDGLQMDMNNENEHINLRKEFITKENIVELLCKYRVPPRINVLSVDIDFNDFYCVHEILTNFTCDIIICEYNATHPPNEDKIVIYDKNFNWDCSNYFGASLLSLYKMGKYHNYSLIYCNQNGVNCFLIHNRMLETRGLEFMHRNDVNALYKPPQYSVGPLGGHLQDPYDRKYTSFDELVR